MHTKNKRLLLLTLAAVALQLVSLLKLTPSFGGMAFYFTGISIIGPLLGAFLFTHEIMALLFGTALLRWLVLGANVPMLILTFGLPTLASSLVFRVSPFGKTADRDGDDDELVHTSRRLRDATDRMLASYTDVCLRVLLPLLSIMLFVMHPVGSKAAVYSLYWLVPVALYATFALKPSLKARRGLSLLASALSATFVAHAVGSIMWLYNLDLTPQFWLGLVPVVPIERMMMAGAIALSYAVVAKAHTLYKQRSTKILATA